MISQTTIQQVFETARIEEVVSEFTLLKKAGANYKALSPFTDEKTPSFVVSPAKQIFKCFSSGKGGNVVTFLKEHGGMTYPEAITYLANKYGIEVIKENQKQSPQNLKRQGYLNATAKAQELFVNEFQNHPGARSYMKGRGFHEDALKKFGIGFAPANNLLLKTVENSAYAIEHFAGCGLIKENDKGRYDFFRDRITFPIKNITGQVVGFGGRVIGSDQNKTAKYINSPDSEIYNKTRTVYGLHEAKSEIIKRDMCYLVEGYTDVISFHQSGAANTVSTSGTAITSEQLQAIRRFTQNLCFVLDGDAAGKKALYRGIDLALQRGFQVYVLLLENDVDPDELAKQKGTELPDHLKSAVHFLDFLLHDLDSIRAAKQLRVTLNCINDTLTREMLQNKAAQSLNVSVDSLKLSRNKKQVFRSEPKPDENKSILEPFEREILRLCCSYPQHDMKYHCAQENKQKTANVIDFVAAELKTDNIPFTHPEYNRVFEAIQKSQGNLVGNEQVAAFMANIPDYFISPRYSKIDFEAGSVSLAVIQALYELKKMYINTMLQKLGKDICEALKNNNDITALAQQAKHLQQLKFQMKV